jgi:hypothetical protein
MKRDNAKHQRGVSQIANAKWISISDRWTVDDGSYVDVFSQTLTKYSNAKLPVRGSGD